MHDPGATLAAHPSVNPTAIALGILLMWCSWADYGWFAFLLWIPRKSRWGFIRDATKEEETWDRLKMRIIAFLAGLGLVIWQVGLRLGIWNSAVPS